MPKMGFNTGSTPRQIVNVMPGSEEQEAIWQEATEGSRHIVVKAVAGSGKTWTGIQYCLREKGKRIAFVAFNKHIQAELSSKISQHNVTCKTYHSLGLAALKTAISGIEVDTGKLDNIVESLVVVRDKKNKEEKPGITYVDTKWEAIGIWSCLKRMVSYAKQYGASTQAEFEQIADHHLVDMEGIEETIYDLIPKVLIECKVNTATIDYDDMIWLPRELGIKLPRYHVMIIDEAQDTNPSQQWLAVNSADRLIVIGDPNQAIYGFRGADVSAMARIEQQLGASDRGVVVMPLSYTRRCPK